MLPTLPRRFRLGSTLAHACHFERQNYFSLRCMTQFTMISRIDYNIPPIKSTKNFQNLSTMTAPIKKRSRLPAPITLTEKAADRIKEMLCLKENAVGVRVSVKRRGCNGYSYTMNYVYEEDLSSNRDEVVFCHGVKVFVDPKAIFFLVGTEMDFVETEISSEFTFTNPNSKGQCGCGESFNV
mmetsp:Transcript_8530/g.11888  ORF Transcript_8530/g.11888 Transcript_8530/m.11888 type:complete len:182 (-) Transcript_8530:28-573(-)